LILAQYVKTLPPPAPAAEITHDEKSEAEENMSREMRPKGDGRKAKGQWDERLKRKRGFTSLIRGPRLWIQGTTVIKSVKPTRRSLPRDFRGAFSKAKAI
jgi:hypothetical protein